VERLFTVYGEKVMKKSQIYRNMKAVKEGKDAKDKQESSK